MTTNKPETAQQMDARAEFESWSSIHFFLQEEDTSIDDSDEYISGDMQLAWEAYQAGRAECEKLRRDAERYRWLREQCGSRGHLTIAKVGTFELTAWSGDDPDSAIDAAMEKNK